jgi:gluconokinase
MSVIVVMGVAGSGKTTVGTVLAMKLGVEYAEADTFHSAANIKKMSSGVPLTDDDRLPWLRAIREWVRAHQSTGGVVSCSALKRRYRDVLRSGGDVLFLHLQGSKELIAKRMENRSGHFMPVSLVDSQLADLEPLEPDERGLTVHSLDRPEGIAATVLTTLAKEPN